MKLNLKYLMAFTALFAIEAIIAVFIHDDLIRPNVGDILVVVLLYCFIKIFLHKDIKLLPLYIFLFATCVEIGQYFHLVAFLGLSDNKIASVILGSTFDFKDIACYFIGCLGLFLFQIVKRKGRNNLL